MFIDAVKRRLWNQVVTKDIQLHFGDKTPVFEPLNPNPEFHKEVKRYLALQFLDEDYGKDIRLTVTYSASLDEERFRTALSNWFWRRGWDLEREQRRNGYEQISRLAVGILLTFACVALQQYEDEIGYKILSIVTSFSLSRVVSIWLSTMPTNQIQRGVNRYIAQHTIIVFRHQDEKNVGGEEQTEKPD